MLNRYTSIKKYETASDVITEIADDVISTLLKYYDCDSNITIKTISGDVVSSMMTGLQDTPIVITNIELDSNDKAEVTAIRYDVNINIDRLISMKYFLNGHVWMIAQVLKVLISESIGRYLLMSSYIGKSATNIQSLSTRWNFDWKSVSFEKIINQRKTLANRQISLLAGLTFEDYAVTYANIHRLYEADNAEDIFNQRSLSKYLSYEDYCMMCQLFDNYDCNGNEVN